MEAVTNQKHSLMIEKCPIYYGWVVLFAGTIGTIMSIPGQTAGVAVFTDYFIDAFGLSRSQLSFCYMLGTIASSLTLPWAGRKIDKYGSQKMVVFASLSLATFLGLLAFADLLTDKISHYFAATAALSLNSFAILFLFFGVRHFGQGQLTVISRTMIGRWFESRTDSTSTNS